MTLSGGSYGGSVDPRREAGQFIRACRDRLTPENAGLIGGANRRVPGLRREEVALLASISVDYYGQIERGDLAGVSYEILSTLAHALHMSDAETSHLFELARAIDTLRLRTQDSSKSDLTHPFGPQKLLEYVTDVPTWIRNDRMDFLAANPLGRALFSPLFADPIRPANNARFLFLNEASRDFYPDWDRWSDHIISRLRRYALHNPHDLGLNELIGELFTQSEEFRTRWAAQKILTHSTREGEFNHPQVGLLTLYPVGFSILDRPGLTMFAYIPEAGSQSEERLRELQELSDA